MEWQTPAVVLDGHDSGENGAIITFLTAEHGLRRASALGARARSQRSLWQRGNIILASWKARLPEQLGHVRGEMLHPVSAVLMESPQSLAALNSACALCLETLADRQPHPRLFEGLVQLLGQLCRNPGQVPWADIINWEQLLLAELGFGLNLASCAVTGAKAGEGAVLVGVSPRTGRAVSAAGAGRWRDRLLPLPPFMVPGAPSTTPTTAEALMGLRLTGHFLRQDVFDAVHKPLPLARATLEADLGAALPSPGPSPLREGSEKGE
ncbi:DNA repair protein RecO [Formicincola oecophyllae]|uniref:DNA repair protein RecO n=1 Tax=Formicincola oecophyllae TaxID=2558361 RepID=A0A4Y6UD18_9PROT|nr:DNA repair protein RecO [Formicincola oecophyllae]